MNRRWRNIADAPPGQCWVCLRPLAPHQRELCGSAACETVRLELKGRLIWHRSQMHCLYCAAHPLPGARVCETHQWSRHPCPGCGGRVPRLGRQGGRRLFCLTCRPHRPRRLAPRSVRDAVSRASGTDETEVGREAGRPEESCPP